MTAPYILDRVKEVATVSGLGDILLQGAVSNKEPFSKYVQNDGDRVSYYINDYYNLGGNWESGVGTFRISNTYDESEEILQSTTYSITRDNVISSSNNDQLVEFTSGTKVVESNLDRKILQQLLELIETPYWS